ncbi:ATP-binding protein [Natronorubrum texcoconense]|uniref:histidine kinase n=1 Tax=Natronorubrum texcoconense TaxID=1095776 RepID=A0A1G9EYK4_9EURY|nr:PAS domain-containing sensor histidine kinase [Natronorubrum texcoconense]SDK81229.1 PAS domain S-box-containing protein [Natronorubrum texcoconense]
MDGPGLDGSDELTILSRAELEERVRQRTADLENVMDTMVDVLVKLGPDGRIRMVNAAATDVLGYEQDVLVGKPIDHVLADGPRGPSASSTVSTGEFVETLVRENRITEYETALVTAEGEEIPTSLSASILRDDDGVIEGVVCVATDISERTEAEERAAFLHSLLRHDLGNKLTVTYGYLELLAESATDLTEEERQYCSYAREGVEESMNLVENVRTLNRLEEEESITAVDLHTVLEESVARHADLADRQDVDVRIDADADVAILGGALLKELFANLLENALIHADASEIRLTTIPHESTVRVHVDDDGRGVPPNRRDSILERGETDGEAGGTGLGTYLAARIASSYGGDLAVDDSPIGGARFTVTLRTPAG